MIRFSIWLQRLDGPINEKNKNLSFSTFHLNSNRDKLDQKFWSANRRVPSESNYGGSFDGSLGDHPATLSIVSRSQRAEAVAQREGEFARLSTSRCAHTSDSRRPRIKANAHARTSRYVIRDCYVNTRGCSFYTPADAKRRFSPIFRSLPPRLF